MVAETISNPPAKPKRRNASPVWSLVQELAVQTMYLTDGMSPKHIASALQVSPQRVSNLVFQRGWSKERAKKAGKLEAKARAGEAEHIQRVVKAQAAVAEAGSIAGLKRALQATESDSEFAARDFRSWAGGARDLVNVARLSRGLDQQSGSIGSSTTLNLTQLVIRGEPLPAPVKLCEQVTEVEAQVIPVATDGAGK